MKTTANYTRVSTIEQAKQGSFGLPIQRKKGRQFADLHDYDNYKLYEDPGFSGATTDRPMLNQLLSDIESGIVSRVIVHRIDRLSRKLRDLMNIYHDYFEKYDVALISVTEPFDTSTKMGRVMMQMLGVFAQWDHENIVDRLYGGRKEKARCGGYIGGRVPFGYELKEQGGLTVDPDVSETVRGIFGLWEDSGSLSHVARELNREGIPTQSGNGKWYPGTVKYIVENPIYKGRMQVSIDGSEFTKRVPELAIVN